MFRAIRTANTALHYVAGALIVGVMLITVYNILGRWLFGEPFRGTVELTELAMLGIVYLGLAFAQHRDSHISVDLLYRRFRRPIRQALDVFSAILSVVVLGIMAWQIAAYADVLSSGGRETAARAIPLAPFAYVAVAGVVAYALASAATVVERLRSGRQESTADATRRASQ